MARYEATFEIDEKSDYYAARRILEQVYDTIREESASARGGTDDPVEFLEEFGSLRDAAQDPSSGKLTIAYEEYGDEFDE